MKKLTLKDLQSLAHTMAYVSETEQRYFVGGGTGGNLDPFTYKEYENMLSDGTWNGGFVLTDGQDGSDSFMQYIPSPSPGADEDLECETFESQMSLYENHQIMTMALGDTGNDGGTVPSGYWTDSGYWTGSGYIDGYYDESGVWITSGSWSGSFEYGSGVYNPEEDCYDKDAKMPELTITAYGSKGGPTMTTVPSGNGGSSLALDLGVETGNAFNDFIGYNLNSIIKDRTKYMAPGEVAHRNIPITVKMPVGTFDTSQKLLMQLRNGAKVVGWAGLGYSAYETVDYFVNGQYVNGVRKLVVTGMQMATVTLIPGWGIAISYVIGVTDTMIGY